MKDTLSMMEVINILLREIKKLNWVRCTLPYTNMTNTEGHLDLSSNWDGFLCTLTVGTDGYEDARYIEIEELSLTADIVNTTEDDIKKLFVEMILPELTYYFNIKMTEIITGKIISKINNLGYILPWEVTYRYSEGRETGTIIKACNSTFLFLHTRHKETGQPTFGFWFNDTPGFYTPSELSDKLESIERTVQNEIDRLEGITCKYSQYRQILYLSLFVYQHKGNKNESFIS